MSDIKSGNSFGTIDKTYPWRNFTIAPETSSLVCSWTVEQTRAPNSSCISNLKSYLETVPLFFIWFRFLGRHCCGDLLRDIPL